MTDATDSKIVPVYEAPTIQTTSGFEGGEISFM